MERGLLEVEDGSTLGDFPFSKVLLLRGGHFAGVVLLLFDQVKLLSQINFNLILIQESSDYQVVFHIGSDHSQQENDFECEFNGSVILSLLLNDADQEVSGIIQIGVNHEGELICGV